MQRPCIEPGCPRLTSQGPRCPGHARAYEQGRRAHRREAPSTRAAARLRRQVQSQGGAECAHCYRWHPAASIEVDHILPLRDGGTDTDGNVQPLCRRHHVEKTTWENRARG